MMLKVFDLLKTLGWYLVSFIYNLIDALISIIKRLNAFDIINSISGIESFRNFYKGVIIISLTIFALFIIWKFINKFLDSDEETTFNKILLEIIKCGSLIMLSTFLFVQVSNFSISLSNYTGNIFEDSNNVTMSSTMLSMFISYKDSYANSDKFSETKSIAESINDGSFNNDELYLAKYVTKSKIIFADDKDYKYEINWLMALFCGGFFLYSLFFVSIMLGRRQIEFLFLFSIAPLIFGTSVCNKQRRGALIEQLVSLTLQSAVIMLVVSLSIMVMQQVNDTVFFSNSFLNTTTKTLFYLGAATFILTGSQVVNRFIGSNVSASNGREQLMSLMGYGKMAGIGATVGAGATVGGGLLLAGSTMKAGKTMGSDTLSKVGLALGSYGVVDSTSGKTQSRMQKMAQSMGSKMWIAGQKGIKNNNDINKFNASDSLINFGASSLNNAVKKVVPRVGYNTSYYRRRKNMM